MEGRGASAGATPAVVRGRGRRSRDGTGTEARGEDGRVVAPGDCLKRLVLADFQGYVASVLRAEAGNNVWESLSGHSEILVGSAEMPILKSESFNPSHPRRCGGDDRTASVRGHGFIRVG